MKKIFGLFAAAAMLTASVSAQAETITITSADELKAFRDAVNNGDTYEGDVIELTADIDLGGESWTPISNTTDVKESASFKGTFDGNGHAISNFNVNVSVSALNKPAMGGLFGLNRGTIKNLKVADAIIRAGADNKNLINHAAAGAIAGINGANGYIYNCCTINCNVTSHVDYRAGLVYSYAAGIVGAQTDEATGVVDCYVNENTSVVATKNSGNKLENRISNAWDDNNPQTDCCSTAADYEAWRAAKNEEAFLYCNLGVQLGSEVPEPYYWDANGITPDIYYVLMIDENRSQYPERKRSNAEFSENNEKMDTYVWRTDIGGDGNTYTLFAAGSTVTVVTHLEGATADGLDSGWFIRRIGDIPATIGEVISDDKNFSAETGRYERVHEFSIEMPAEMTTIWYDAYSESTTEIDDVAVPTTRVIADAGRVTVETVIGTQIFAVDITGRVVYAGRALENKTEIALESGIYIVNGVKVAVK